MCWSFVTNCQSWCASFCVFVQHRLFEVNEREFWNAVFGYWEINLKEQKVKSGMTSVAFTSLGYNFSTCSIHQIECDFLVLIYLHVWPADDLANRFRWLRLEKPLTKLVRPVSEPLSLCPKTYFKIAAETVSRKLKRIFESSRTINCKTIAA